MVNRNYATEVGIYKRKQENTLRPRKQSRITITPVKKKIKKTRSQPRKRSRKREKKTMKRRSRPRMRPRKKEKKIFFT